MRGAHLHFRIKHPDNGETTTQMMFEGKDDDEIRTQDRLFHRIPDFIKPRVLVEKQSPRDFPSLAARLQMEPDAVVCRFDQAFL